MCIFIHKKSTTVLCINKPPSMLFFFGERVYVIVNAIWKGINIVHNYTTYIELLVIYSLRLRIHIYVGVVPV